MVPTFTSQRCYTKQNRAGTIIYRLVYMSKPSNQGIRKLCMYNYIITKRLLLFTHYLESYLITEFSVPIFTNTLLPDQEIKHNVLQMTGQPSQMRRTGWYPNQLILHLIEATTVVYPEQNRQSSVENSYFPYFTNCIAKLVELTVMFRHVAALIFVTVITIR